MVLTPSMATCANLGACSSAGLPVYNLSCSPPNDVFTVIAFPPDHPYHPYLLCPNFSLWSKALQPTTLP